VVCSNERETGGRENPKGEEDPEKKERMKHQTSQQRGGSVIIGHRDRLDISTWKTKPARWVYDAEESGNSIRGKLGKTPATKFYQSVQRAGNLSQKDD